MVKPWPSRILSVGKGWYVLQWLWLGSARHVSSRSSETFSVSFAFRVKVGFRARPARFHFFRRTRLEQYASRHPGLGAWEPSLKDLRGAPPSRVGCDEQRPWEPSLSHP